MKDECGGTSIQEFIGLRPKMYSLLYDGQEKKTAKGVKKTVIDEHLKHESYKQVLLYRVLLLSMRIIAPRDIRCI